MRPSLTLWNLLPILLFLSLSLSLSLSLPFFWKIMVSRTTSETSTQQQASLVDRYKTNPLAFLTC